MLIFEVCSTSDKVSYDADLEQERIQILKYPFTGVRNSAHEKNKQKKIGKERFYRVRETAVRP